MPEPTDLVAWEDLRVGETYWGAYREYLEPTSILVGTIFGVGLFKDDDGLGYNPGDFYETPDGRPMIYATCADACRAMIARLEQFMAEQGGGNG